MSCLFNTISTINIHSISECIPSHCTNLKTSLKTIETVTTEVAKGIFSAVLSHIKETFPSIIFHAIHISFPALTSNITFNGDLSSLGSFYFFSSSILFMSIQNKSKTEIALQMTQFIALAATVTELAIGILFPPSLAVQLTVRGIVLFAGAVGNMRSIQLGAYKIHEGLTDRSLETSQKVSRVVSGLISVGLGVFGLSLTAQTAKNLYNGLQVYQQLDPTQQKFVLKYYGLESLGVEKSKTAIIINGFSSEWAEPDNYYFDNTPSPPNYVIYQNYNTRTYEVTSSREFATVLNQASKELGGNVDLISVMGHGNNTSVHLSANYDFMANKTEVTAIQNTLVQNGNLLLWGCKTAKPDFRSNSVTKSLSKMLPDKFVTGFAESLYPSRAWAWFTDKLHVSAWNPTSGAQLATTYQNGTVV